LVALWTNLPYIEATYTRADCQCQIDGELSVESGLDQGDDRTQPFVALTAGTSVSHYRIIKKIGSGGMGEVYLAEDTKLDRKVALKFLPPHLCADDDCRKRFTREAQAAAKLSHPNIIHVYEVSEYQGRPFFAMEHVEGRSLREFSSDKELSIEQILELAIQICEGLNDAHEKGVTHRDIKPSNILIDSHGRAKIVDFGLASVVGSDQLTKTGSTLGTVGYMSPEQVKGKEIDHRSDLFSLGVVLYELITRQNPFKRDSEAATLKAVSDDTPHPVARYRADAPDGLQSIIDKSLEKDVRTRYQHADGMLSELMRVKRSLETGLSTTAGVSARRSSSRLWWYAAALVVIAAAIVLIVIRPWHTETTLDEPDKIMLAVLPFENLGDPEDEYFADGMTDEIIAKLATINALGVTSRTSAMHYKGTNKSLRDIGKELGVDYILEGTIRWDKTGDSSRVRIIPQLVRVHDDVHVWADKYDHIITDIFAIQSDISKRVVEALDITLVAGEQVPLDAKPTNNIEAYGLYLRGMEYLSRSWDKDDYEIAQEMFSRAIALDSTFAAAYANLSRAHTIQYWYFDVSKERLAKARQAVEKALRLDPDNAMAHLAMAQYHYHGERKYDQALAELETASRLAPSNAEVYEFQGYVKRRQGKFTEAIDHLLKAIRLNPRSQRSFMNLAGTYLRMRDCQKAEDAYDRAVWIFPEGADPYIGKAWIQYGCYGDIQEARRLLESATRVDDRPRLAFEITEYDIYAREFQVGLDRLIGMTVPTSVDSAMLYERIGYLYFLKGERDLSAVYYDSARLVLEGREWFGPGVQTSIRLSRLGIVDARLGRKSEAIQYAKLAVERHPVSLDAYSGTQRRLDLAHVYIIVGEHDLALDELTYLMSVHSGLTVPQLRIDPLYDPLRENPRFQALIEKYEKEYET
jgi:serine/threonine protein kinase/tetratricopeptide (TPR) repeat protein